MQCFFVYFSPILDFFQSDTATLSITTSEKFYSQHIRLKQGSTLHRHQKEHPTYYKTKRQPNRHGQTALITIYIFMIPSCLLSLFFQNASYLWVTCVTTQSSQPFLGIILLIKLKDQCTSSYYWLHGTHGNASNPRCQYCCCDSSTEHQSISIKDTSL